MARSIFKSAPAILVGIFLAGSCQAQAVPVLAVSQNANGEVIASVSGMIPKCGVTALHGPPTFSVSGKSVSVKQKVAGVMCRRGVPPDARKPYSATLNLGRLPAGTYTIDWSFPQLKATYTVVATPD